LWKVIRFKFTSRTSSFQFFCHFFIREDEEVIDFCYSLWSKRPSLHLSLYISLFVYLRQWFPTGVPRHTRVPWRDVRVAAKYWIYYLLSYFTNKGAPNCHFSQVRVPPNFFQSYRVPWTKKGWKTLIYGSVFQPWFRGTQRFRQFFSRCVENSQISTILIIWVAPNTLYYFKGSATLIRLKNTDLRI